ncbi:response regulator [Legionella anisa]|uniref:Response regulator n=1 Tax=Legionella anisa TaxID=28082 RepID=A0AAX0WS39_9GAMM|nr:response regulator [Legionella anisa]AWN74924.1 response regulator [Legionella anisa]KTC67536.1 Two component response regulator [Legionella anisa]MCW8424872.1 response regulator [Legionella anisa]MCW8446009.1 response regulator [Legionella anisa]PNL61117.1 response regulator [Legionella anisa]
MTIVNARPTCFYHPIRVIFLDDNRAFLDVLDLEFGQKFNIMTLTSPDTAFRVVDNHSQDVIQSIFKLMEDVNVDTTNDRVIAFDISKMLNLIYNKTRFEYIPLLVVDYEMPTINGIEFCRKLKERKIFKIMLTAEADTDTAIKAFNNGLIDKFILKTSENLYPEITLAVDDLTQRYFRKLTKNIVNAYANSINDLFDNELYQQLFASVLIQAQAVEYYLVDNSGSFLFLDKDAKPTWLIIRHVKELSDQLDLMQGYELPEQTMAAVEKKEKILFLLSEKEYKKPIVEWVNYLFDAKKLDNNYYYSITQDYLTDSIDWERVVSYSSYIAERDSIA